VFTTTENKQTLSVGTGGSMSEDVKVYSTGKVKFFNTDKGFGFIQMSGGILDVFVHAIELRRSGIDRCLVEDETVKFVMEKGPKGSFATHISITEPK
jgi:cold shock protein